MTNDLSRRAITNVAGKTGRRNQFDAPKGQQIVAQGFNPGLAFRMMRPESGARWVGPLRYTVSLIVRSAAPNSGASFAPSPPIPELRRTGRAHLVKTSNPGLKPWAILFCPFGAGSDRRPRKQGRSTCLPT